MRVLHLVPSLTGGGAERQLALLTSELCRLGVASHIGFVHGGVNLEALGSSPVVLHHIRSSSNYDPLIIWYVRKLIHAIQPDIIQTWLTQMDVLGGIAAMIARVPFVVSERSSRLAYPSNWKNCLRKHVGDRAVAIVANSEGGASYWRKGNRSIRIEVIPNGLDLPAMQDLAAADPRSFGLPSDTELIVFAGRLSPEKNVVVLVDALDEVLSTRPNCSAILFGEGPLREAIDNHIRKTRACSRILLKSYTKDLWQWMRRASIFVSISVFEGNPNAVLEAMALSCPLVVSNIPQHKEILDDTSALFCDPNSIDDVAAAITAVLTNTTLAGQRAVRARKRSAIRSIDQTAKQYLGLYEALVRQRRVTT